MSGKHLYVASRANSESGMNTNDFNYGQTVSYLRFMSLTPAHCSLDLPRNVPIRRTTQWLDQQEARRR